MIVKVINKSNNKLPEYATPMSAGFDLRANLTGPVTLKAGDRMLIGTGLYIALGQDMRHKSVHVADSLLRRESQFSMLLVQLMQTIVVRLELFFIMQVKKTLLLSQVSV